MINILLAAVMAASPITPPVKGVVQPQTVTATELADAMRASWNKSWGRQERFDRYARLFVINGHRWNVHPVLVACVAYAESRYHEAPPGLVKRVFTVLSCPDRPGPCYNPTWKRVERIVKVNRDESGMMQVLYYDRSSIEGYRLCTGKRLVGRRDERRALLRPPKVNVCVGTYELAHWRDWAHHGKLGRIPLLLRLKVRTSKGQSFYARHPRLLRYIWVRSYNHGCNRFKANGYDRGVLRCFARYRDHILLARSKVVPRKPMTVVESQK